MSRVNRHVGIVLRSIAAADSNWCADFFQHPTGGFGFEHFRSDPEDRGGWSVVGGFSATRYETVAAAGRAAVDAIGWISSEPAAKQSLELWLAEND